MLNLYKKKGETPLERIDRFRIERPEYRETTLSYAGRLDPMAEGVLLVMEGDENKEREKYLEFDKTYEVEILFGVSTDTHDVLGMIDGIDNKFALKREDLEKELKSRVGKFIQKYPNYSSKTVLGIPLFEYARKGQSVDVPTKEVTLYKATTDSLVSIKKDELLNRVINDISLVKGDFRQEEIKKTWENVLNNNTRQEFLIAKLFLNVSSGFYVRVFADTLGRALNTQAIAVSIKRTISGEFGINESIK
jgi:tRNA pseudouridine(55) synthase